MSHEDELIPKFERDYGIRIPEAWKRGRAFLIQLLSAQETATGLLGSPPKAVQAEFCYGPLAHLSMRAFDHVVGAIVCFATGSPSTAELAARVAVETSVNIRFILAGDRNSLTFAWLRDFVLSDAKQIQRWNEVVSSLSPDEQAVNLPGIATRTELNEGRQACLSLIEAEAQKLCKMDSNAHWPKQIAERFAGIGASLSYRTTYARLSSQTHADAEDTLNLMIMTSVNDATLLDKMKRETVAFSEYMVMSGAHSYLMAIIKLIESFGLTLPKSLTESDKQIMALMISIGDEWNW